MKPEQQFEIFHKVDVDSSGKLDFSEFCYFIHMVGDNYSDEAAVNLPAKAMKMLNVAAANGGGKGGSASKLKAAAKKVLAVADAGSDDEAGSVGKAPEKKSLGGSSLHSITKAVLHKMGSGMSQRSSSTLDDNNHSSAEIVSRRISSSVEEENAFGPPSDDETAVHGSSVSSNTALPRSHLSLIKEKSKSSIDAQDSIPSSRTQSILTIENDLITDRDMFAEPSGGGGSAYASLRRPSSKEASAAAVHPSNSFSVVLTQTSGVGAVPDSSPTLVRAMSSSGAVPSVGKDGVEVPAAASASVHHRKGVVDSQAHGLDEVVEFVVTSTNEDSNQWRSTSNKNK
jgi:hypothetical protein